MKMKKIKMTTKGIPLNSDNSRIRSKPPPIDLAAGSSAEGSTHWLRFARAERGSRVSVQQRPNSVLRRCTSGSPPWQSEWNLWESSLLRGAGNIEWKHHTSSCQLLITSFHCWSYLIKINQQYRVTTGTTTKPGQKSICLGQALRNCSPRPLNCGSTSGEQRCFTPGSTQLLQGIQHLARSGWWLYHPGNLGQWPNTRCKLAKWQPLTLYLHLCLPFRPIYPITTITTMIITFVIHIKNSIYK